MNPSEQKKFLISLDFGPFTKIDSYKHLLNRIGVEAIGWIWLAKCDEYDRLHTRVGSWYENPPGETTASMWKLRLIEMFMMPTEKAVEFAIENEIPEILVHTTEAKYNRKVLGEFSKYHGRVMVEGGLGESIEKIFEITEEVRLVGIGNNFGVVVDLGHLFFEKSESLQVLMADAISELKTQKKLHPDLKVSLHIPLGHNGTTRDEVKLDQIDKTQLKELLELCDSPITIEAQGTPTAWVKELIGKNIWKKHLAKLEKVLPVLGI